MNLGLPDELKQVFLRLCQLIDQELRVLLIMILIG